MNPIKCIRIERIPGTTPPAGYMPPGYSWCATQVEHVPGLGQWTTWALVADEVATMAQEEAIRKIVKAELQKAGVWK